MSKKKIILFLIVSSIYASTLIIQVQNSSNINSSTEQAERFKDTDEGLITASSNMFILQHWKGTPDPPAESSIDFDDIRMTIMSISTGTIFITDSSLNIICLDDSDKRLSARSYSLTSMTSSEINTLLISILDEIDQSKLLIFIPALVTTFKVANKDKTEDEGEDESALATFHGGFSIREKICQVIEYSPGIHFRELCRELNKKNGVIQYHLWILESENRIKTHKNGGFTRYFSALSSNQETRSETYYALSSMFQRQSMVKIIEFLETSENGLSRSELASELGITLQGVTCNCKKLLKAGLIEEYRLNRQKYYKLTEEVIKILNSLDLKC